jgi:two-component system cell cycle response regulator CpdR
MVPQRQPEAETGILVVDDDPDVREIVSEYLAFRGYSVLQAGDGAEALDLLRDNPDLRLVISDVRMRGISGLELAARAAKEFPGVRVILISGYFQAQEIGPRFLKKPFTMNQLETAVQAELPGGHV